MLSVKLGQVLASRPDLLPEPYLKALARLQDKVKHFLYTQVEEIVTAELGVRIPDAFARFDREPLAAASLVQVHRATLRDGLFGYPRLRHSLLHCRGRLRLLAAGRDLRPGSQETKEDDDRHALTRTAPTRESRATQPVRLAAPNRSCRR